jgi:hypothetical protein
VGFSLAFFLQKLISPLWLVWWITGTIIFHARCGSLSTLSFNDVIFPSNGMSDRNYLLKPSLLLQLVHFFSLLQIPIFTWIMVESWDTKGEIETMSKKLYFASTIDVCRYISFNLCCMEYSIYLTNNPRFCSQKLRFVSFVIIIIIKY